MSTIRRDSVQSLERAFDLFEALAAGGELGVTELAERTGLVPSTAHRLLATLTKRDYVTQNAISGRYLLGYKVVEVASGLEHRLSRLRAVARPHLERIQQATGETSNLVILDGEHVVYVDQVEGSRRVRMFTVVGTAALAHTTGAGKAIMAYSPPEVVASRRMTSRASAGAGTRSTTRSMRRASGASPRRSSTTPSGRARRLACPGRPPASCTPTRPNSPRC